ncbi:MAG: tRNA (adenosine(37)-N6)-dimethylallyltransferase MiaA [Dehalococcoidia bacterium]|nr:tRNA (adenosine(37)-N6)-dimethylallyltransferase MiaA [Dehalococcoidia bacterium]
MPDNKPLIAIVGPTAVGKSKLALEIARCFEVEIVNGDSRQVYRYMDIGTAKASAQERDLVQHHLVDILDPDEPYSLALYLEQARRAVQDVQSRGKLPCLVGGTGQYVWGLLEGFHTPQVAPNPALRAQLEEEAAKEGQETLWRRLQAVDHMAASHIDHRNVRRVVRALEVYQETGIPFSQAQSREPPPYNSLVIGLTTERRILYEHIDRRVEAMVEAGWPQEVTCLLERGYYPELPSMSSLGYREVASYVQGKLSLKDAVARIKNSTRRFARHQYAWLRLRDSRIHWLEAGAPSTAFRALDLVNGLLRKP